MKVIIRDEVGAIIDELMEDDPVACAESVGETVAENIHNELTARQVVEVVER